MKATLVEREGERAVVRLTPSWLARKLGARETVCELRWHVDKGSSPERRGWVSMGSRRWLDDIKYGRMIKNAMDHAPVMPLPKAGARLRLVVNNDKKDREASE